MPDRLHPEDVDAIARRVVELLAPTPAPTPAPTTMVDAEAVARRFGVERSWVYQHSEALGAIRLGTGPRARLRFDPELVATALKASPAGAPSPPAAPERARARARARPHQSPAGVSLLPIRQPEA